MKDKDTDKIMKRVEELLTKIGCKFAVYVRFSEHHTHITNLTIQDICYLKAYFNGKAKTALWEMTLKESRQHPQTDKEGL